MMLRPCTGDERGSSDGEIVGASRRREALHPTRTTDVLIMSTPSADARTCFEAAVRRVQADRLMPEADDSFPNAAGTLRVVGMGKAALAMAGTWEDRCPDDVDDGVAVVPEGHPETLPERLPRPSTIRVLEGGHPLPSQGSVRAGRRILEQADAVGTDDVLVVLISGGGTALSSLPVADIDLADLKAAYHRLLTAGVPIQPANVVRKHLTQVGGGQLAQAASPGRVETFAVSDVIGNDLSTIASGPTVPDPSTYTQALQVLYRHDLWQDVPGPVRDHLAAGARGRRPETPGPDASCFRRTETAVLGHNETALDAARKAAKERGYDVRMIKTGVDGEARAVGRTHVDKMRSASVDAPTCWLWGGETTVSVTGKGTGGRNQEVALGAALALEEMSADAVLLSGGTDGIDGPTDAAGAWATPLTAERARAAGCDPEAHLAANDAYSLFDKLGQLLRLGPTHTNVMDVQIGLVCP